MSTKSGDRASAIARALRRRSTLSGLVCGSEAWTKVNDGGVGRRVRPNARSRPATRQNGPLAPNPSGTDTNATPVPVVTSWKAPSAPVRTTSC